MAKLEELSVEVTTKLTVDEKTANLALQLVEMYVNANSVVVICEHNAKGESMFYYEPAR